mgnify:CR=1 FL=1
MRLRVIDSPRIAPAVENVCQNSLMPSTDTAHSPPDRQDVRPMQGATRSGSGSQDRRSEPPNRFGAAASIVERLDLRPLHIRQRRPWWRLW